MCLCCMDVVTFSTHTQAAFSQIMSSLCNSVRPANLQRLPGRRVGLCLREENKERCAFFKSIERQDIYRSWMELHELMTDEEEGERRSTEMWVCCGRGVVNWISWALKQGRDALRRCQRSDRTEGELRRGTQQSRHEPFFLCFKSAVKSLGVTW